MGTMQKFAFNINPLIMDILQKEELLMTKKNTEIKKVVQTESEQSASGADFIWDGWINSFKAFQGFQNEIEERSLEVLANQKELLVSTKETLKSIEKASKEQTNELRNQITNQNCPEPIATWVRSIEEINDKSQTFSWNSDYAVLDFFIKFQGQFEEKSKELVEVQRKIRNEGYEKIEDATEQVKQSFGKVSTAV